MPSAKWDNRKKNESICNIFLYQKQLSEDHVPPKAIFNNGRTQADYFIKTYDKDNIIQTPSKFIQNGLKLKTICRDCNSKLGEYDRSLIELANLFASIVKSKIIIPKNASISIIPNAM